MLFLASTSPRRHQLLAQAGFTFRVLDTQVPEVVGPGESARDYVCRVARAKARAGWEQVSATPMAVVLAADTEVVLDGQVFGKPEDEAAAAAMLRRLSGREHEVFCALCGISADQERVVLQRSAVSFRAWSAADIADYLACGEWRGKAGAYAIQGRAGGFVSQLDGSFSGVMGLALVECIELLASFGVQPATVRTT